MGLAWGGWWGRVGAAAAPALAKAEEAQPEGGGGSEAGGSRIAAWWRERVVTPLLDQLRRGVDAPSLARSTAMGVAVGLGPLPGLSSVIVGAIAVAGGHNMVAAQVAQLVMAPGKQPRPATHPCCSRQSSLLAWWLCSQCSWRC